MVYPGYKQSDNKFIQDKANGLTAIDRKTDQEYAACAEAAEFLHGNVYSAMPGNDAAGVFKKADGRDRVGFTPKPMPVQLTVFSYR